MKKSLLFLLPFLFPHLVDAAEKPRVKQVESPRSQRRVVSKPKQVAARPQAARKVLVVDASDAPPDLSTSSPPDTSADKKEKKCKEPYGIYLTGDFLYWTASEEGLTCASTGFNTNESGTRETIVSSVKKGAAKNFHTKWSPGFQIGAGGRFREETWDVYLNWTRFYQHNTRFVHKMPQELHTPLNPNMSPTPLNTEWIYFNVDYGESLNFARAKWRLHYNTLDFELGRTFTPNHNLSLRPHAGLRGVLILQRYKIDQEENHPGITPPNQHDFVNNINNFRGVAIRAGLDTVWYFAKHFGLYGDFAASLASGKFEILNRQRTQSPRFPDPYINQEDHFFAIKPCLEAALGFQWDTGLCCERYHIGLDIGWEMLWWPHQNQMRRYLSNPVPVSTVVGGELLMLDDGRSITEKGDLSIQGLVVGLTFGF
ncbi:MAG: hypothetical protein HYX48_00475 [Chlamydiales bacterium]|nr:hypothetical protein [Chlamydiales bacterium]